MEDSVRVEIDGIEFTIEAFDVKTARKVSARILPILGKALTKFGKEFSAGKTPKKIDKPSELLKDPKTIGAIMELIGETLPEVDEDLIDLLCEKCAAVTTAHLGEDEDGREMNPRLTSTKAFDLTFRRKTRTMYRWLFECLKFNFADFLPGSPGEKSEAEAEKTED